MGKPTETHNKPELLAPSGSLEAFFAAMESGADAVYAGLREFSARARAKNFTLGQMGRMLAYAHQRNRKIYVTLNTLVKEKELSPLVETLAELARLNVDGIIVQDMAVARLVRRHFPSIPLHASTQMTIHNLPGVLLLQELGFQRVVLARELQSHDIAEIASKSSAELEIFVHGALCFCVSGQCHFSSLLGGHSGNRGRCAQPCRRLYSHRGKDGYFFSPNDLSALEIIPELARIGVRSLKIEGRMKPADYVAKVVSAYRTVLDAPPGACPEAVAKAKSILRDSFGRTPTKGFISSNEPADIVNPWMRGGTGRFTGEVKRVANGRIQFETRDLIRTGDRLRLQPKSDMAGQGWTARELFLGNRKVMECPPRSLMEAVCPFDAKPGDAVFKVGAADAFGMSDEAANRKLLAAGTDKIPVRLELGCEPRNDSTLTASSWSLRIKAHLSIIETELEFPLGELEPAHSKDMEAVLSARFGETGETPFRLESLTASGFPQLFIPPARLKEIRRELYRVLESELAGKKRISLDTARKAAFEDIATTAVSAIKARSEELLITLHSPADLRWGLSTGAAELTVPLTRANIHALTKYVGKLLSDTVRIRWSIPFMLFDRDIQFLLEGVRALYMAGFRKFEINNPSHFKLMKEFDGVSVSGGYRLFSLSTQAVAAWKELGAERLTSYLEDDGGNLRDLLALSPPLSVLAYSPVDVMTTRIRMKEVASGAPLRSDRGEEYTVRGRDGFSIIASSQPFSLTGRLDELRRAGCNSFTIDLSETGPEQREAVLEAFRSDRPIAGTTLFNFDRGLQ